MVEVINGIGHPLWSLRQGGYEPGLATAPFLLGLSLLVFAGWRQERLHRV